MDTDDPDRPEIELHEEAERRAQLEVIVGGFGQEPDDRETEEVEKTSADITAAEKVEFLQMTRQGLDRQEAAGALGYKARPWRAITSPSSPFYDETFANAYAETIGSPEAKLNYLERLRSETTRRALMDSDRLLEKLMLVHDPDWSVLRQKDVNINVHAFVQQHFKDLPTELLEQLLAALDAQAEAAKQEVIEEAEYHELTAGGSGEDYDR